MKLNTLIKYKKPKKRIGRGIAAGQGKTCGRGHGGQKSRAGKTIRVGFEGGQTPLFQKLPKYRGFRNINQVEYQVVNLSDLEKSGLKTITKEALLEKRIVRKKTLPIKVLGQGEITSAIKVELTAASQSAIDKITKAGGSFTSTKKAPKITKRKKPLSNAAPVKKDEENTEEAS